MSDSELTARLTRVRASDGRDAAALADELLGGLVNADTKVRADCLTEVGRLFGRSGDWLRATVYFRQALDIAKEMEHDAEYRPHLVTSLIKARRWGEARQEAHALVACLRDVGADARTTGRSLWWAAQAEQRLGNLAAAAILLREAISGAVNNSDRGEYLVRLGDLQRRRDHPEEARRLLVDGVARLEGDDNRRELLLVGYRAMGELCGKEASWREAIHWYEKWLARAGKLSGPVAANVLNSMSLVYSRLGDSEAANTLLARSLELDGGGGRPVALHNLACLRDEQGRSAEARQLCLRALEAFSQQGPSIEWSQTLLFCSVLHREAGDFSVALNLLRECEQVSAALDSSDAKVLECRAECDSLIRELLDEIESQERNAD